MKSTYKLLNIYLDGQSLPARVPKIFDVTEVPECPELEEEMNVFDFPVCRRKISGMKLLSYHSEADILNLIGMLPNCKELVIAFDYNSVSQAAYNLFLKRVLQLASLIMKQYPNMAITFTGDGVDRSNIKSLYQIRE